ncbi:MAG: succinate dehydrogenase iron-sulfur subunit [Candidatus Aminicenantales bacterium]|jgi:succinate dehydrogenase / fumarate reductase iron-sulfur subunit
MMTTFKILRYDPTKDEPPHFQSYVHEAKPRDSVMEALKDIRDQQDPSLSFRYSCREAVCGSCSMAINGEIALSCRTLVSAAGPDLIVLEPLPNMEILRDLVVDMAPFWEAYRFVQPYLQPEGDVPPKGHRIEESALEDVFRLTTCILCASCYAACPVVSREVEYLGPAALAKLHRFVKDPRDRRPYEALKRVDSPTAVWGCDTVFRCNAVCPKEVQPAHGIEGVRRALVAKKLTRIFRRTP